MKNGKYASKATDRIKLLNEDDDADGETNKEPTMFKKRNGTVHDKKRKTSPIGDSNDSGDDHNIVDEDEEVIYTAAPGVGGGGSNNSQQQSTAGNKNQQVKIELGEISSSSSSRRRSFQLGRMRFVKGDHADGSSTSAVEASDETKCLRAYKFFLLNMSFFIYGAAVCLIINSKQHFVDALDADFASLTYLISLGMLSILLGIFLFSFIVTKYDRFYLLFFASLASSISLIVLPFVNSKFLFALFISLFGLCFGITKTVGYKWCLKSVKRRFHNYKLNMLYIQILIGLFISYTALLAFTKVNQPTSSPIVAMSSSTKLPPVYSDSVVRNKRDDNFTSDFNVSDTMSTTTSTKYHRPKPEIADGGQLEQSHITKPPEAAALATTKSATTKSIQEKIDECLRALDKHCTVQLTNCTVQSSSVNQTSTTPASFSSCAYIYDYHGENLTANQFRIVDETNDPVCIDLLKTNSNYTAATKEQVNCFSGDEFVKLLGSEPLLGTCYVNYSSLYACHSDVMCSYDNESLAETCRVQFMTTTQETTTTSSATTPTTASTTSSTTTTPTTTTTTTTTTTSTTTTTTTTTTTSTTKQSNIVIDFGLIAENKTSSDYYDMAVDFMEMTTKKLHEFYATMNNVQLIYTVLAVMQLIVTAFYSLLALPYLTALLCRCIRLLVKLVEIVICMRLWCYCFFKSSKTKKQSSSSFGSRLKKKRPSGGGESMPMRFRRLRLSDNEEDDDADDDDSREETGMLDSNRFGRYRIEEHLSNNGDNSFSIDDDDDENDDYSKSQQRRNVIKSSSFWYMLAQFFVYGALLANFLLFMNSYLISRLSESNFNQIEIINKFFFLALILGRLFTLAFISLTKPKQTDSTTTHNHRLVTYLFFDRRIVALTFTLLILFAVSFVQMSSSHFALNVKLLLWNAAASTTTPQSSSTTRNTTTSPVPPPLAVRRNLLFQPLTIFDSRNVKLDIYAVTLYGLVYPALLGSLLPHLVRAAESSRRLVDAIRPHVAVSLFWSALLLGAAFQSAFSTYVIYSFKTTNLFIYTNILASSLLILFLVFYCCRLSKN